MILVWYELKKIFAKRSHQAVLFLLAATVCAAAILTIRDVRYYEEDGTVLCGAPAAKRLKAEQKEWEGEVTGEVLRLVVEKIKEIDAASASIDDAFVKKQGLLGIANLLSQGCFTYGGYEYDLPGNISPDHAQRLYEMRIFLLKQELEDKRQTVRLTEQKKAFLLRQYQSLETPLYYTYAEGWKALLDSQYLPTLMIITIVTIGFLAAGIFPDEFYTGADAVFFSSCLGRKQGTAAKVAAGFFMVTAIYWTAMLAFSALVLGVLGAGGAGCMVQTGFGNWESIYNITYGQDWLLSMCGGYAGHLFILSLAMLLSVKSRSAVPAVAVPFLLSCIPMFLSRIPVLAPVMQFFPDMLLRINKFLDGWYLIQIGSHVYASYTVLVPLYLVLSVALVPVLYRSFGGTGKK